MTSRRGFGRDGFGIAEALVALLLTSLAAAALAAAVACGVRGLAATRAASTAVLAAEDALGLAVAGPVSSGADVLAGPPPLARAWTTTPGRGTPATVGVRVRWGAHAVTLETARWP